MVMRAQPVLDDEMESMLLCAKDQAQMTYNGTVI